MWGNGRPLGTDPGRGLAAELADCRDGSQAESVASGAVYALLHVPEGLDGKGLARVYLRGVAAAAVLAEHGRERRYTGARDYALRGREVDFLPGATPRVGLLSVALKAVQDSAWVRLVLREEGVAVPPCHVAALDEVIAALESRVRERMKASEG